MVVDVNLYIAEIQYTPPTSVPDISDPISSVHTEENFEVINSYVKRTPVLVEDMVCYTPIPNEDRVDLTLKGGVGMKIDGIEEDFELDIYKQMLQGNVDDFSPRAKSWFLYYIKKYGDKLEGSSQGGIL